MPHSSQNPLTARFETTPLEVIEAMVAGHFGLTGSASVLNSERDETFRLTADDGRSYIVKLASPQERQDVLVFQTEALQHLAAKHLSVPLPQPVASLAGPCLVPVDLAGERRTLRILTFLDGTLLYRIAASPAQLTAIGRTLAEIGSGLADFRGSVPEQNLLWDLCRATQLRTYLPFVAPERQSLVSGILDAVEALGEGPLGQVRQQVIHNDFNPHNILVDADNPTRVTGVIDFGDMVEAPLVNDLAVALSYQVAGGEGLDNMLLMLQAYHAVRPLQAIEIHCLPALLRTRLAMTLTITEWRASLYPENRDYILRNHPLATQGLQKLSTLSDSDLANLFHHALGDLQ